MQHKPWKVIGVSLLLAAFLTGCEVQLPTSEEESLKVIIGINQKVSNKSNDVAPPPVQTKKDSGRMQTTDNRIIEKAQTPPPVQQQPTAESARLAQSTPVMIIGALVHPVGASNPQLITVEGTSYELVTNHTKYDIYTIRKEVSYIMAKVQVVSSKDKLLKAELLEVVTEGKVIQASVGKSKGKHNFKNKNKNYVVTENRSGKDLDKYMGQNNYFFVHEVGEDHGSMKVIIYEIY